MNGRADAERAARAVCVTAPSRLHFGMLSFNRPGERQYGGAGAMIDAPGVRVRVTAATRLETTGAHAERARGFALRYARAAALAGEPPCRIAVLAAPRQHVGLGLGTQLGLAVAAGLDAFLGGRRTTEELARAVGRGQRSAVGLHGFARGGLLVEAGKHRSAEISPLVARLELPAAWRFVLLCPREGSGLAGRGEREAFADLPPVPREVTAELCRELLLHLLPAAQAGDFAAFSESLYRYGHAAGCCFAGQQHGAFATAELARRVEATRELGVAGVGQSSWGPLLFALMKDEAAARAFADRAGELPGGDSLEVTIAAPDNAGARVEIDPP